VTKCGHVLWHLLERVAFCRVSDQAEGFCGSSAVRRGLYGELLVYIAVVKSLDSAIQTTAKSVPCRASRASVRGLSHFQESATSILSKATRASIPFPQPDPAAQQGFRFVITD
jgi:hypothetical protein